MDAPEIETHRAILQSMLDELTTAGSVRLDPNRTDEVAKTDEDAQPLNEMHQAIASRRNQTRTGSLRDVRAALRKIEETPEDFGLCEECDEEIAPRRLELMPYARFCVKCKSAAEAPLGGARKNLTDYV